MSHEYHKRYRPKDFPDMLGQDGALKPLQEMCSRRKVPHTILFTGPSGCGKTTAARIVARKVGCVKETISEINCADFRGIDTVRDIRERMGFSTLHGKARAYIVDEAHQLSKDAQNAFLKILEDTPEHVYFLLCTTDPAKLLTTVRTRCCEIRVQPLKPAVMKELLLKILKEEGEKLSDDVITSIIEAAEGSARKGLVILESVLQVEDELEQLKVILSSDVKRAAFDLVKALMPFKGKPQWAEVAKVLKDLEGEEPEQLRHLVLACCRTTMLKGGPLAAKAFVVTLAFRDNFYDSKHAGLVAACYEVVHEL